MGEIIRLSISEAARFFGVNSQTIRRAVKNQEITYSVVRGRYEINFESLLKWSQKKKTTVTKLESKGIGQYVDKWKIKNPLFSPNPSLIKKKNNGLLPASPQSDSSGRNIVRKKISTGSGSVPNAS
ncbi:MAG: helix-turn-helix domain-containing protein [Candidatus Magasanikbacteria bacterium]|nr:helix-turn-helix domain-containing protein [Candidatus Magasanikbacteria bacterium]